MKKLNIIISAINGMNALVSNSVNDRIIIDKEKTTLGAFHKTAHEFSAFTKVKRFTWNGIERSVRDEWEAAFNRALFIHHNSSL